MEPSVLGAVLNQYIPLAPLDLTHAARHFHIEEYDIITSSWTAFGAGLDGDAVEVSDYLYDPYFPMPLTIYPCTNYNEYERFELRDRSPPPAPPPPPCTRIGEPCSDTDPAYLPCCRPTRSLRLLTRKWSSLAS